MLLPVSAMSVAPCSATRCISAHPGRARDTRSSTPVSAGTCRRRFGYPRRATVPDLDRCVGAALACMGQILGEKNDRHGFASARFSRRNDIDEAVAGVVAARLISAWSGDLGPANLHPLTVCLAPVAVDH